jgi:hypothetical protein
MIARPSMNTRHVALRAGAPLAAALVMLALLAGVAAAGPPMMGKTGDLNMDGSANSLDALQVLVYDAGLMQKPATTDATFAAADVNCDVELNALDASLILQHDAGLYNLRP